MLLGFVIWFFKLLWKKEHRGEVSTRLIAGGFGHVIETAGEGTSGGEGKEETRRTELGD